MTRKILETAGSDTDEFGRATSLANSLKQHRKAETVSFHTPGHKSGSTIESFLPIGLSFAEADVTELPGLDDFTNPNGVIAELEKKLSRIWRSSNCFVSLNGASAALCASILSLASSGKFALIPENCHRSIINALVLSGMEPLWYDVDWHASHGVYGSADARSFSAVMEQHAGRIACALAVSVDYSGAISKIENLAQVCEKFSVPLVVDEAHGAHRIDQSALHFGADIVVHSLHKTLGALTQTGVVHTRNLTNDRLHRLKSAMNLLHSSSPSYLLMSSIECSSSDENMLRRNIERCTAFAVDLRRWLSDRGASLFSPPGGTDELHILFQIEGLTAQQVCAYLTQAGVYPETNLGEGTLLMVGVGTTADDITKTKEAIEGIFNRALPCNPNAGVPRAKRRPVQVMSLREAWFSASETVPISEAAGRIASDCVAPCPPGTPVLCPGQRVPDDIADLLPEYRWLRVVIES